MYYVSFNGFVVNETNCKPGDVYFTSLEDYENYITDPIRVVSVSVRYNRTGYYYVVDQVLD